MKTIINNHIPFGKNQVACMLFGLVFVRRNNLHHFSTFVENHEKIHAAQYMEVTALVLVLQIIFTLLFGKETIPLLWMSLFSYYIIYVLAYLWLWLRWAFKGIRGTKYASPHQAAIHTHFFEAEAYANDDNLFYVKERRPFNFVSYF